MTTPGPTLPGAQPAPVNPDPALGSPAGDPPAFTRRIGETPRAFQAFLAWFQLGPQRSLQAVADALGEKLGTVKVWSSRHRWGDRLNAFTAGLLQQQVQAETALQARFAADWADRTRDFREQQWVAGQKLLDAVSCFLENLGDRHVERITLGQAARAMQIATRLSREALGGLQLPDEPSVCSLQQELEAALNKAYGQPSSAVPADNSHPPLAC